MLNYCEYSTFPLGHGLRVIFPCLVVNDLLSCSKRAILVYEAELNPPLYSFFNQLQAL